MNSNTIPVSVIIPNYNSEYYLEECIKSINSSKWPAEILIIDDCSTDNSFSLANQLEKKYSNIKIFQCKKNSGAAEARKLGINNASQELIALVDADDLLEAGALEAAYTTLISSDADICIWDLWRFDEEKQWQHYANPKSFPKTGSEAVLLTLGEWGIHPLGISYKKIYQKSYNEFKEISFNADELITRIVFNNAKKIVGCKKKYFYRVNLKSTSSILNAQKLNSLRSRLWLLNFSRNISKAPIEKMANDSIAEAWFYWKNRKKIGNNETLNEIKIYLNKIIKFPRIWYFILVNPKSFAKILLLSIFVFQWQYSNNNLQ